MPVYMIRQGERGPVKIGTAKDVARRLGTMQSGNHERLILLRMFEGGVAEERLLHKAFADHRITGEWFSWTQTMLGDVGLSEIATQPPVWNGSEWRPGTQAELAVAHKRQFPTKGVPKGPQSPEHRAKIAEGVRNRARLQREAKAAREAPP